MSVLVLFLEIHYQCCFIILSYEKSPSGVGCCGFSSRPLLKRMSLFCSSLIIFYTKLMYYYTLTVAFWSGLENSNTWYTWWCLVKHGLGQNRPIYNVKHVFNRITSPMWTLKKKQLISLSDVSGTTSTRRHELLHQISSRSIQRLLRQYLNLMLASEWNQTQWVAKGFWGFIIRKHECMDNILC